jgi:hypothetical protein
MEQDNRMNEVEKRDNSKDPTWTTLIPDTQWEVYKEAIRAVRHSGAHFLLGGAFALAYYIGRCRNTKDLDFFVLPSEKDSVIDALTKIGFDDYYQKLPYDRGWIFRATRGDVIVDTIWQTPNRRSVVDEMWLSKARPLSLRGEKIEVLPPEELLSIKLYVLQRDRCDWPDLLNLLHATCDDLDWEHVISRMNRDAGLLGGLLHVFNWLAPGRALALPMWLRRRFCLADPTSEELALDSHLRVNFLDTRPWYAAFHPQNEPMKV